MPNAARQIWPHLQSSERPEVKGRQPKSLAEALYPAQSRDQRLWNEIQERNRQVLLRNLREASGKGGR
jgi:hypothetical protein